MGFNNKSLKGLLEGIEQKLGNSKTELLVEEFNNYYSEEKNVKVESGKYFFESIQLEDYDEDNFRENYQNLLVDILTDALKNKVRNFKCCEYHNNRYNELRDSINNNESGWLQVLLETVWVAGSSIHNSLLPDSDYFNNKIILSRLMPLELFLKNHVLESFNEKLFHSYITELYPKYDREVRIKVLKESHILSKMYGRFGSYPSQSYKYTTWCENLTPFFTKRSYITENFDRTQSPCELLAHLGVPFDNGVYYIEIQIESDKACIHFNHINKLNIPIPTFIDAAGFWAYKPDRDKIKTVNYARKLHDLQSRGAPELQTSLIDIDNIFDAIVWQKPTSCRWDNLNK